MVRLYIYVEYDIYVGIVLKFKFYLDYFLVSYFGKIILLVYFILQG